jgi:glutathione S-transferase
MSQATLAINSRNYGAWSLRGWLMCRFAGLDFSERVLDNRDPGARAELLLLSPSFLVPSLDIDGMQVWDTLAIGEYLWETHPDSSLLPSDPSDRAWCRSVCGEMHAGFAQLRAALPMNVKARHPGFKIFSGAQADIDRIVAIWQDCLRSSGGPLLFGTAPTMADAMYAPVCTRFVTYDVELPEDCATYVGAVLDLPDMVEWLSAAEKEPDDLAELDVDVEF